MKDTFELEIGPDGTIRTMYQEGLEKFAEEIGGDIKTSCRASDVEWEEFDGKKGWTVRSAYHSILALRNDSYMDGSLICSADEQHPIKVFQTREEALAEEVKFFWQLMEPQRRKQGNV